jgi:hypothetical protein
VLRLTERLWDGPRATPADIARAVRHALRLGRDLNALLRRIADETVPRFEAALGVPVRVRYDEFLPGACPDPPAAAQTVDEGGSSACLQRVREALATIVDTYPLATERIRETLAAVVVERGQISRAVCKPADEYFDVLPQPKFCEPLQCFLLVFFFFYFSINH